MRPRRAFAGAAIALACALSAPPSLAAPSDAPLRDQYFKAITELEAGNSAEAIRLLDAITVGLGKATVRVQVALVHALSAEKLDKRTLAAFKTLERLGPLSPELRSELEPARRAAEERLAAIADTEAREQLQRELESQMAKTESLHQRDSAFRSANDALNKTSITPTRANLEHAKRLIGDLQENYPHDARLDFLAGQVPVMERRVESSEAVAARTRQLRREAEADEQSGEATRHYVFGSLLLTLSLASAGGGIAWIVAEPLGSDAGAMLPPVMGFATVTAVAFAFAIPEFQKGAWYAESAARLREKREETRIRWGVTPMPGGVLTSIKLDL